MVSMANDEKLIRVTNFNTSLNRIIGSDYDSFCIYRSKGLLAHLLNRKHYVAAKYIDFLPEIISTPDYIGQSDNGIEFVKCYKDSIFVCVKLDTNKEKRYVATMFEVKQAKIESYLKNGRLNKVDVATLS